MRFTNHRLVKIVAAAALFAAGFGAGTWRGRSAEAQNRFGQPKSVLHVVVYKWKNFASQDDKDQAIKGIKTLAAQIPNPTQQPRALTPADTGQPMPIFRVTVVLSLLLNNAMGKAYVEKKLA